MAIPPRRSVLPATKRPLASTPPPAGAADPGSPVNPSSRAVNPRLQYPLHFDLLMRDLFKRGETPEEWQVIAADEVRLDDGGMDIEFTLLKSAQNAVVRRRVDVEQGRLLRITDCATATDETQAARIIPDPEAPPSAKG
jgi:hypothetical protein